MTSPEKCRAVLGAIPCKLDAKTINSVSSWSSLAQDEATKKLIITRQLRILTSLF